MALQQTQFKQTKLWDIYKGNIVNWLSSRRDERQCLKILKHLSAAGYKAITHPTPGFIPVPVLGSANTYDIPLSTNSHAIQFTWNGTHYQGIDYV